MQLDEAADRGPASGPGRAPARARRRPSRRAGVRRRGRAAPAPGPAGGRRWPAASRGRPARSASPPPRRTPHPDGRSGATPARAAGRPPRARETTPSGPSYAPPSSTESRCEPTSDRIVRTFGRPCSAFDRERHGLSTVATRGCRCRRTRPRGRGAALLEEPGAQLALGGGERLAEVAAAGGRPPHGGEVAPHPLEVGRACMRLPWSSRTSYAAAGWSAATPTDPVDPAVVDRALRNATRAPNAGFSQGWAFLVLDTPEDVAGSGPPPPTSRSTTPDELAAPGMMRAPVVIVPLLQQGGLPRPVRRARQGLDRPGRGPLAGAVLAHGRRDGRAADPADRRRRGPRRLLLRHPAGAERGRPRRVRRAGRLRPRRRDHARPPGIEDAGPEGSVARGRRPADEVVHRGGR